MKKAIISKMKKMKSMKINSLKKKRMKAKTLLMLLKA